MRNPGSNPGVAPNGSWRIWWTLLRPHPAVRLATANGDASHNGCLLDVVHATKRAHSQSQHFAGLSHDCKPLSGRRHDTTRTLEPTMGDRLECVSHRLPRIGTIGDLAYLVEEFHERLELERGCGSRKPSLNGKSGEIALPYIVWALFRTLRDPVCADKPQTVDLASARLQGYAALRSAVGGGRAPLMRTSSGSPG